MKIVDMPIKMISLNPQQPRKVFRERELEDLSKSLMTYGVLQPLIVKRDKGKQFILVAGERRYRAAQMAGFTRVPVVIKELDDKESAFIALVENLQREELNFLEEAKAYKKLIEQYNLTQEEISKRVNKQQSTISNKIRLLSLPRDVQDMLISNNLTERHARALLKLNNIEQVKKVLNKVIENQLNVKHTEKIIDDILREEETKRNRKRKVSYISYKIYLNTLRKAFDQVKEVEEGAVFKQEDLGEYMEITIKIPKNNRCFT